MTDPSDLFQEWRAADRAAHDLEQEISRASIRSLSGQCEPPSAADHERAHRLRNTANDLFHMAMAEMKERAEANQR